ncbi:MAG: M90 family metallopeptidase [Salinisphaeraceae bacterium]
MTVAELAGWSLVVLAIGFALWLLVHPWHERRRQRRGAAARLTPAQQQALADIAPGLPPLTPLLRDRLADRVAAFLADTRFHSAGGFVVDDACRVAIAAQACLLRLQPDADGYPAVRDIVVYPDAFWVHHEVPDELGLVDDEPDLLAGEAWDAGRVVLSWSDVQAALEGDPVNVVVHEFAHQLDFDRPDTTGAPPMDDYREWSTVMREHFDDLRETGSPVLDPYGSENPAEFFAVAVETYVQNGADLARAHPELYRLLDAYFGLGTAGPSRSLDSGAGSPG